MSARIEQAAVRAGGKVWTLPRPNRHHNILYLIEDAGLRCMNPEDQGFVLDDGSFIGRKDAADLAIKNGQVVKLIAPPDLYSEDLW